MNKTKKNEDTAQRSMRLVRDRLFRATGENPDDPEYRAGLWALQQMRDEIRKANAAATGRYIQELLEKARAHR